jgi:hypothetical protein
VQGSLNDGGVIFTVSTIDGGAAVQTASSLDYESAPAGGTACGTDADVNAR